MNTHPGKTAPIRRGGPVRSCGQDGGDGLKIADLGLAAEGTSSEAALCDGLPVQSPGGSCPPAGATRRRFGAVKGQKPPRGKQVTVAEFRRMWYDPKLTLDEIGRILGICNRSVWQRAKHRGMPPRPTIMKPGPQPTLDAEAEAMWRACVRVEDIAAAYGTSVSTVHMHVHRNGVKRARKLSRWHPPITLDDYRALQLREALAARAREEQAALALAEMVDGRRRAA